MIAVTAKAAGTSWAAPLDGLPLRWATPAGWSALALADLDALLSDHAHCEKKAAAAAMTFVSKWPENDRLVRSMVALAHEELRHFRQVHDLLRARGASLGRPQPDRYVRALRRRAFQHPGGLGPAGDGLLVDGLIEARSCERMRRIVAGLEHGEGALAADERDRLRTFYRSLAAAEARHWESFRDLAVSVAPAERVDRRLAGLAEVEASIVRDLPLLPRMH